MRDVSMLDGGLRKFMIDAVGWLDEAEDELLILEEDFQSEYSNSGGPAENDLRLANVKTWLEKIRGGTGAAELNEMTKLLDALLARVGDVMRGGSLDLSSDHLGALLRGIDGIRDQFDSLESGGECAVADPDILEALTRS